jgi:hypothetical protein
MASWMRQNTEIRALLIEAAGEIEMNQKIPLAVKRRVIEADQRIDLLEAQCQELREIVGTWLAYCDHAGIDEDAERHPDNPSLNPVKALCERSRAALARKS